MSFEKNFLDPFFGRCRDFAIRRFVGGNAARVIGPMLCGVLISLAGCKSSGPSIESLIGEINATNEWTAETIAAGDVLNVRLAENSSWDHSVTVRPDGSATFLGLPPQQVAGMRSEALESRLDELYAPKFSVEPRVSVQFGTRVTGHVMVMGEVTKPGEVVFDGQMNFHEVIALAGGLRKDTACPEATLLIRWMARERRQRVWKFDASLAHWKSGDALHLQPDDVLFVPNTAIDDVDIWVDQYIRRLLPFPYIVPPLY